MQADQAVEVVEKTMSTVDILQTYGGWGVAILLIGAVGVMWRYIIKLNRDHNTEIKTTRNSHEKAIKEIRDEHDREQKDTTKLITGLVEKVVETSVESRNQSVQVLELLKTVIGRLENVESEIRKK